MISNNYTDIVLRIDEYFRVDPTVKHKKEKANLRKQCNILKQKLSEATACYRDLSSQHTNTKQLPQQSYKSHQREEKALEPEYVPQTVTIVKQPDESRIDSLERYTKHNIYYNKMTTNTPIVVKLPNYSDEICEAVLLTAGAVGISMTSTKLLKESLGTPESAKGMMKLAFSVFLSSIVIDYAKGKKFIPDDPFKPKQ
ncbi:Hypothetical predicted protein [Paramuricea clavata]|uniref:Uncharacterized protein n=1 Tax=Paramuricea clavata TaxID=317549 RepID=A0A6S7IX20_PARCT|nr:Hypothetical predicted protein [Paramuricea clavata]